MKNTNRDNYNLPLCCQDTKKGKEYAHPLFFEYVVAKQAWLMVFEVVGFSIGSDYESIAKCWLCNKKFDIINMVSSAQCWGL
jgi:hypothetical protein